MDVDQTTNSQNISQFWENSNLKMYTTIQQLNKHIVKQVFTGIDVTAVLSVCITGSR